MLQILVSIASTVTLLLLMTAAGYAEPAKSDSITVQTIMTAQYYSKDAVPTPALADVAISTPSGAARIVSLEPFDLTDPVQLYLVIDNCSDLDPGPALGELNAFLRSEPPNTAIGSAYIRDGHIAVVQPPTHDRESLIRSLTPPTGCEPVSPFAALSELIQGWEQTNSRRVVVLISNGVDPAMKLGYKSESAERALAVAQRAGVAIYAIYHPDRKYKAYSYGAVYSGQVLLSHLAWESGGQGYFLGAGPLDSVAPFLSDIAAHLEHQYRLAFVLAPDEPGGLQPICIRSNNPAFELVAPTRVWTAREPGITQSASAPARSH